MIYHVLNRGNGRMRSVPLALPVFAGLFDVAAWPIEMRHPNLPMIHDLSAETISPKFQKRHWQSQWHSRDWVWIA
jgi:hypothetical protein